MKKVFPCCVQALLGVMILLSASDAGAWDFQNARPMAMGGAGRANCPSNAALYLNPAGVGLGRMYHVETLYGYAPTAHAHIAGGSVVDSVTSPVAMGLSFNYVSLDADGIDRNEYDVRLAAAYYISRLLSIGLSLRYINSDQEGRGPLTDNLFTDNGDDLLNTITLDVGTTLTIGQYFALAVVGHNLTNTRSTMAPLSIGVGLAVTVRSFALLADVLMDFNSRDDLMVRAMGGAEYFVADHWPIRLGYRWDQMMDSHSITGGFGYFSDRFGIELSLRQDVSNADDHLHTHIVLGLRYFANQQ